MLQACVFAQATLDVPSSYPDIDAALAVAQPGDLVLVQSGTYAAFTMNVGVTILAPNGATIANNGACSHCWAYTQFNPPPGQPGHLVGLQFRSLSAVQPHLVGVVGGHLTFTDCQFYGGHPAKVDECLSIGAADVVLEGCAVFSSHDGLVSGGNVVASRSSFAASMIMGTQAPYAIRVTGGRLELNDCSVVGADAYLLGTGWPAMRVMGGNVSLTDTSVLGGDSVSSFPVPAVLNQSTTPVRHCRSTMIGGMGFVLPGQAGWQVPGPPVAGLEAAARILTSYGLVEYTSFGAPRVGSGYRIMTRCLPGSLVVVATGELMPSAAVPFALEPLRLSPSTAAVISVGTADVNGLFMTASTGPVAVQLFGRTIWFQPVMLEMGAIGIGAPVGGVVY